MSAAVRFYLALLGLISAAAGLLALALGFGLLPAPGTGLMRLVGEPAVAAAGGGLLLLALVFLILGLRSTAKAAPQSVLQTGEYGEIHIAIVALENMVLRVIQQTQGVKDGGRRVHQAAEGLVVHVKIKVMPDLELPDLVSGLQGKVKEYLEHITGIVVHEVKVLVENIILDQAPAKKTIRPI